MTNEWQEIRGALRREYGHPYTYRGVQAFDYTKHPFAGRACALLLKAEKIEAALVELLACEDDEPLPEGVSRVEWVQRRRAAIATGRALCGSAVPSGVQNTDGGEHV